MSKAPHTLFRDQLAIPYAHQCRVCASVFRVSGAQRMGKDSFKMAAECCAEKWCPHCGKSLGTKPTFKECRYCREAFKEKRILDGELGELLTPAEYYRRTNDGWDTMIYCNTMERWEHCLEDWADSLYFRLGNEPDGAPINLVQVGTPEPWAFDLEGELESYEESYYENCEAFWGEDSVIYSPKNRELIKQAQALIDQIQIPFEVYYRDSVWVDVRGIYAEVKEQCVLELQEFENENNN